MDIVGSEIFWNSIAEGLSTEQRVSPICMSEIPDIATIDPISALSTSTLFKPSNSYNLEIFTLSHFSGLCAFTTTASWLTLIEPLSTLPIPILPTYSL